MQLISIRLFKFKINYMDYATNFYKTGQVQNQLHGIQIYMLTLDFVSPPNHQTTSNNLYKE